MESQAQSPFGTMRSHQNYSRSTLLIVKSRMVGLLGRGALGGGRISKMLVPITFLVPAQHPCDAMPLGMSRATLRLALQSTRICDGLSKISGTATSRQLD